MRGLVIFSDVSIQNGSPVIANYGVEELMVKRLLPYWDKFDLPQNPFANPVLSGDISHLISEGIVQSTPCDLGLPLSSEEKIITTQLDAWKNHEAAEPGAWSLAQNGDMYWLPESVRVNSRMIEVILHSALPMAGELDSFDDVLWFKDKRSEELEAFRNEMDSIYLSVINSGDIPRSLNSELTKLASTLSDITRVADESFASKVRSSVKVQISLPDIIDKGVKAGSGALAMGFPFEIGAVTGAIASAVSFEAKVSNDGLMGADGKNGLLYAYQVGRDLNKQV